MVVNPANIALGMNTGVTIEGVPGYTYGIQYTTDMHDTNSWMTATNLTLTKPVELWVDTSVNVSSNENSRRYYRVTGKRAREPGRAGQNCYFGIAKILRNEAPGRATITQEQQVIGTPHYVAPEQVEHPQRVDHRADSYPLGVVFYEMLTGELPLGKFPPPSRKVEVDVRLDEVVLKALEKEPEQRYQQASQVKDDVETIASQSPWAAKLA